MGKKKRRQSAPARDRKSPRRLDRRQIYWVLAIGLSAVVVYLNAFGNGFVLDDTRLIRDDLRIRSLANVPHLFASPYWDINGAQALYRPLVLATYALNYAVGGLSTYGYTAVNIALHAGVSLLLFALVRAIGGSLFAAGAAGLLFAVHPVHTEAVTGISGRPELLAAFFMLLAMHLHRRSAAAHRGSSAYRVGTLVCFAAALLSKESAMTLLLVLPVMDALAPAERRDRWPALSWSRAMRDYVPLLAVALLYLAARQSVLGRIVIANDVIAPLDNPLVPPVTSPLGDTVGATPAQAVMTAFAVVDQYARLLLWPARLSPDYSYNQIPLVASPLDVRFIVGVALVAACAGGIVVLWRRNPVAAFGLAFLALTFSIVSNFVIRIGTICAERLIYLPGAGALIVVGVAAERLARGGPLRRGAAYGVLSVLIVISAARTWARNRDWKDEVSLWSAAVTAAPESARVQSEYGRILLGFAEDEASAGRSEDAKRHYAEAQEHFETALKIYPSYSPAIDGLATIYSLHDRFDEAMALYRRAMAAWPGNYGSLTNWGSALWQRSKRIGAKAVTLRRQGRIAESDALVREADAGFTQASEKIDQAIAMRPSYAQAHLIRAMILETYRGDRTGAIAEYEEVLRLMPNHPQRALIEDQLQRLRTQQPAK
jgi:tetratricopeptide (TPR) repeat protein